MNTLYLMWNNEYKAQIAIRNEQGCGFERLASPFYWAMLVGAT